MAKRRKAEESPNAEAPPPRAEVRHLFLEALLAEFRGATTRGGELLGFQVSAREWYRLKQQERELSRLAEVWACPTDRAADLRGRIARAILAEIVDDVAELVAGLVEELTMRKRRRRA